MKYNFKEGNHVKINDTWFPIVKFDECLCIQASDGSLPPIHFVEDFIVDYSEEIRQSSLTNSRIGSEHWFNTLVAGLKHENEYLCAYFKQDKELQTMCERMLKYTNELILGYSYIQKNNERINSKKNN